MAGKKFSTTSGIEIKEVYTEPSGMNELPGEFPYTRGIQKDMYRGRPWTMRQYAGMGDADAALCADLLLERLHHVDDRLDARLVGALGRVDPQTRFLTPVGIEDDAFNFRAAEIDADAHDP